MITHGKISHLQNKAQINEDTNKKDQNKKPLPNLSFFTCSSKRNKVDDLDARKNKYKIDSNPISSQDNSLVTNSLAANHQEKIIIDEDKINYILQKLNLNSSKYEVVTQLYNLASILYHVITYFSDNNNIYNKNHLTT